MRSTFKVLFYLKRDKQKKDGSIPLYCRITVNGDDKSFGLKKDINPKLWDVKSGTATGRTKEASAINDLVNRTRTAIDNVYRQLLERENDVSAEKVKNTFLGFDIKCKYLLVAFDEHNKEKKELSDRKVISKSTFDKYRITRDHLAEFLKKKRNLSDIALKGIDYEFIVDFERFLLTDRNCAKNTTAKYMQFFKHIIILALKKEWIYKNPFNNYSITVPKSDRGYLTQSEVETLMQHEFTAKRLERVRDIFVFCCFCGLPYIDVKNLTEEGINRLFDSKLWITGKRGKTDVSYEVPLLEVPRMILEKYRNSRKNNRLLPVINNQNMNKYLKEIGDLCGIKKKLTFHLARHTFATLTLTQGVAIESVSKMLGHTNISTTQIYAQILNEKVSGDMTLFAKKLKGIESKLQGNSPVSENISILGDFSLQKIRSIFSLTDILPENRIVERILKIWKCLSDSEKCTISKTMKIFSWDGLYNCLIDYLLDNHLEKNTDSVFHSEINNVANF